MVLFFSDLHARRILLPIAETTICLGDSVGYRKNPEAALENVRDNSDFVLKGNHDAAACGQLDDFLTLLPDWLKATLEDTEEVPDYLFEWLATLPAQAVFAGFDLYHGSARDPLMEFLVPGEVAEAHLALQRAPLSFVGHTHRPLAIGQKGSKQIVFEPEKGVPLDLSAADRWALNPGSLGVRYQDRYSYLLLDPERGLAHWHFPS